MVEMCYKTHTTTVNPIIDWTDGEVWEFIKEYNIPYCTLYDEGFKRLGCIGCPMGSKEQRIREFERWPKYKNLYLKAFKKMVENRNMRGGGEATSHRLYPYAQTRVTKDFTQMTPEEIIEWWID